MTLLTKCEPTDGTPDVTRSTDKRIGVLGVDVLGALPTRRANFTKYRNATFRLPTCHQLSRAGIQVPRLGRVF